MITILNKRIMIVPDFGVSSGDGAMPALKKSIEAADGYDVKVVDLPALVRAEHEGEDLTDAKVIELSARKLEQLAWCGDLIWDGSDRAELQNSRIIRLGWSDGKFCRISEPETEPEQPDESEDIEEEEIFDFDEPVLSSSIEDVLSRDFPHHADGDDYNWGEADIVVVFGKSAMLAGGLGQKDVLFINPE